jgi:hypothetical protein
VWRDIASFIQAAKDFRSRTLIHRPLEEEGSPYLEGNGLRLVLGLAAPVSDHPHFGATKDDHLLSSFS